VSASALNGLAGALAGAAAFLRHLTFSYAERLTTLALGLDRLVISVDNAFPEKKRTTRPLHDAGNFHGCGKACCHGGCRCTVRLSGPWPGVFVKSSRRPKTIHLRTVGLRLMEIIYDTRNPCTMPQPSLRSMA
jgi:hypothetical protein